MINLYPGNAQEILRPAKPGFIVLSLGLALVINCLPWSGWALWLRPDFVALLLLFWCIHQPRKTGFTFAWCLGLMMDVSEGSLLGQHALAYTLITYFGIVLHRRVPQFSMASQMIHILPLLLFNDLMVLAIRMGSGSAFPGYGYFVGSLIATLLWPTVSYLLKLPQRPFIDPDQD
ncbi:MAG: rod shape-determining protein MreD [Betaproteobacteria bacterium]|jgi:rod shape-determining protein MreD